MTGELLGQWTPQLRADLDLGGEGKGGVKVKTVRFPGEPWVPSMETEYTISAAFVTLSLPVWLA